MPVVFDLDRGVDADGQLDAFRLPVGAVDHQRRLLPRREAVGQARHVERLAAVQPERGDAGPVPELARHDAHEDQVAAVNPLETLRDDRPHAQQPRALGRPVARTAGAVLLSGQDDQRYAVGLVLHGRVVDVHPFARGAVSVRGVILRDPALHPGHHQVLDAHVGERSALHDSVVAAPRAVAVEVFHLDAVLPQVAARGRVRLDRTGRADVVGGDGIAQQGQRTRAADVVDRVGRRAERGKERRLLDVGRSGVPRVGRARRARHVVPERVLRLEVGIQAAIIRGVGGACQQLLYGLRTRPQVAQIDVVAVAVASHRLAGQVDVHPSGERERHDQRRTHQKVGTDVLVDAGLEVPVAAQHAGGHDAVAGHGLLDGRVERAGVADAGRAAVADGLEPQSVEGGLQAGLLQIFGHHARTRSERRLDARTHGQAAFDRGFGDHARGQHHARIGGVRARRNGGDQHVAVPDFLAALISYGVPPVEGGFFYGEPALGNRLGE